MQVRTLLDSGSAMLFVSERVAQVLRLCRSSQSIKICGITNFSLAATALSLSRASKLLQFTPLSRHNLSAFVVPRVTCNLPSHPVSLHHGWEQIKGLRLPDPEFGQPRKIDFLLGVEIFVDIVRHGRRK